MKSFPKLRSYGKFKTTLGPENYILISISKSVRSLLAQLGFTISISERKCVLCNTGVIEDEQHCICNCTFYDTSRINLFNDAEKYMPGFLLRTEEAKFIYIISSDDLTRSLYRFVKTRGT